MNGWVATKRAIGRFWTDKQHKEKGGNRFILFRFHHTHGKINSGTQHHAERLCRNQQTRAEEDRGTAKGNQYLEKAR